MIYRIRTLFMALTVAVLAGCCHTHSSSYKPACCPAPCPPPCPTPCPTSPAPTLVPGAAVAPPPPPAFIR